MFKRAVDHHDKSHAVKTSESASPPPPPSSQQQRAFNPPFKPVSDSSINAKSTTGIPANAGLKRSSNGLPKVFGSQSASGFSDANPAKRSRSDTPKEMPVTKIKTAHEVIEIDDDDFDSDPDLDVEDPAEKKANVAYPKLPSSPPRPAPPPVSYPSLQRSHVHTSAPAQSRTEQDVPGSSSVPLPWSSSPPEHKAMPNLKSFRHHEADVFIKEEPEETHSSSPVTRPTKPRALPWLDNEQASAKVATPGPVKSSSSRSSVPNEPWNASASVIKNNQKELKKMMKVKQEPVADRKKSNTETRQIMALSAEQRHVLDLVVDKGKSIFFTGSAGTGKSVLLREIIHSLKRKFAKEPDRIAVTASTGLAACNIGGVTLHSFAGIGLGKDEVPELVKFIKRNQKAKQRWLRTKYLIIDEVSMVDGDLFDKLEAIARTIRNSPKPFGGIKIVITGDFFQLPPVPDRGKVARFAFDSNSWTTAIDHTIGLHKVFRQKDPEFAAMLNEMREGRLSASSIKAFKALSREPNYDDGLSTTELFPTRAEVETANNARMRNLYGKVHVFEARDGGTIQDKERRDKLLANCMAPETLEVKKGSQVMLIKNIDEQLVNGSLGTVRGFMSEGMWDEYQDDHDEFDYVQATDAKDLNPAQLKKKRALQLYAGQTLQLYPLVRFSNADGTTRDLLCNRESWKIELPNGEVQASRSQVPLILAWALSIHKAQGQTLERVKVDLGKVFERGQAYVALSRATSMAGLQVLRFDPAKVQAHERVRAFYASLTRLEIGEGEADEDLVRIKSLNSQLTRV